MASIVALNASPEGVLRSVRGSINAAQRAYPDVLHVEVQDQDGNLWKLATQDADWSPSDPSRLIGGLVEGAELDDETGELRFVLADGSCLKVFPAKQETEDDPPNWKLFTPEGLVLVFGPGGKWRFNRADQPVELPLGPEALESARIVRESEELALTLARQELASRREKLTSQVLLREHALRNDQLFLVLAVGLSIVSMAVAAISLAFALQ